VITKRTTLTFEVGVDYAMLVERDDPELQHLVGNKFSPGYLLLELQKCGLNLLPIDEDAKAAHINLKDRGAEERAIKDIVTTMRSYAYRSTKWNQALSEDRVCVKLRENLEFDREFLEDHEPDWTHAQWWNNKCAFNSCSEEDAELNDKLPDGMET
jgi:cancer susceptibility candidate protein 1